MINRFLLHFSFWIGMSCAHEDESVVLFHWFVFKTWWRHQMETFSALLALLCGEFTGLRWIPHTKASHAELWCFFICAWINAWVNNREASDLRRYRAHYDVTVMWSRLLWSRLLIVDKLLTRFEFHQRQKCDIKKLVWRACQKLCVPHRKM